MTQTLLPFARTVEQPGIDEAFNLKTHNGIITVQSTTGQHRTFRIRTKSGKAKFAPGKRIVELLTGPDNTSDYRGFAFVNEDRQGNAYIALWTNAKENDGKFYAGVKDILENPGKWKDKGFEFMVEGRCRKCNHVLTVPESIRSGIGPKCARGGRD
jgi:hypothetical protein